jgi:hypothetical protein
MADQTPEAELVAARREFMAADVELSRLAAEAPSAFAEDGAVRPADPDVSARIDVVRARMQGLALFISAHAWLSQAPNRFQAWQQVDAAAKAADVMSGGERAQ